MAQITLSYNLDQILPLADLRGSVTFTQSFINYDVTPDRLVAANTPYNFTWALVSTFPVGTVTVPSSDQQGQRVSGRILIERRVSTAPEVWLPIDDFYAIVKSSPAIQGIPDLERTFATQDNLDQTVAAIADVITNPTGAFASRIQAPIRFLKDNWSSAVNYLLGDIVLSSNGVPWIAIAANVGKDPTLTTNQYANPGNLTGVWKQFAPSGATGSGTTAPLGDFTTPAAANNDTTAASKDYVGSAVEYAVANASASSGVTLNTAQTITGAKTHTGAIVVPDQPAGNNSGQAANTRYVERARKKLILEVGRNTDQPMPLITGNVYGATILWNSVITGTSNPTADQSGSYNLSNGRFTIADTGRYELYAAAVVQFRGSGANQSGRFAGRIDGTDNFFFDFIETFPNSGTDVQMLIGGRSRERELTAGQTVSVFWSQSGQVANSALVSASVPVFANSNRFCIWRLD